MRKKSHHHQWMILKLDLEKAYDRVNWDFLRETLDALDLPEGWTNKVMKCVETTSMQVLWNGEKTAQFLPRRGLRQGDPLSPYLFVLIMERLAHLINQALLDRKWKPIKLSRNGPPLTHLFFADDLLLFAEGSMAQVDIIKETMSRFCKASGQKISLDKSVMMVSARTGNQLAKDLASRMGIKVTKDLGKYLGVPTINGRITKNTFQEVITRVHKRLEGWQTQFLSFAGRLTLIKSITSTIPLYTMQTLPLPASVCDEIDTANKRFLWAGDHTKKAMHQVKWRTVCTAKDRGGLGLRSMRQANLTSLAKLGWRFLTENDSLWAHVLATKYKIKDYSPRSLIRKHGQSPIWRGIVKAAPTLSQGSTRVMAEGKETDFWDDSWFGYGRLIDQIQAPIPMSIRHKKVADFWDNGHGWKWNEFAPFLPHKALLQLAPIALNLAPGEKDRLSWRHTPDGKFTFKSAYESLNRHTDTGADMTWKAVWKLRVPERIRTFLWLVLHGRLMTNERRTRLGLAQTAQCERCSSHSEDMLHLLRDCPHSKNLWLSLVPRRLQGDFFGYGTSEWIRTNIICRSRDRHDIEWNVLFAISIWWLWKWRNETIFQGKDPPCNTPTHIFEQATFIKDSLTSLFTTGQQATRHERLVSWKPPPPGWTLINTDGAARGDPGHAAAAACLRDNAGNWIAGAVTNLGICTTPLAELMAIHSGLNLAWDRGIRQGILESDSELALSWLKREPDRTHKFAHLIRECRHILSRPWTIQTRHIYREGNRVADWLAKFGISLPLGTHHFNTPPRGVTGIMLDDAAGYAVPRSIRTRNKEDDP
ncbi:non-LTR retrotransposon transposase [Gossypium australe]|uniref:Non-LTR retrotransposon transposase n=1 Tax=Gossypium australe TaxID=47621 RepID=A0A5B6VSM8_9ROSI|nr:non-LTR retrotransposon transposase [Gossypium australe]